MLNCLNLCDFNLTSLYLLTPMFKVNIKKDNLLKPVDTQQPNSVSPTENIVEWKWLKGIPLGQSLTESINPGVLKLFCIATLSKHFRNFRNP